MPHLKPEGAPIPPSPSPRGQVPPLPAVCTKGPGQPRVWVTGQLLFLPSSSSSPGGPGCSDIETGKSSAPASFSEPPNPLLGELMFSTAKTPLCLQKVLPFLESLHLDWGPSGILID